ncbi:hypothetical protein [Ktedonospora formicarum]|uniref:Uncharacterized protein n=1 Tax=Ktedonospora formicarum TaxID=2778364 RepID=A0A8J3ICH3_9CHLR|nr:hypothetical protein [Ktedonospora formicarum]GHO51496.1 hypothetical protein KSX_96590 [Ktedonospora formicarum]GHO51521.1 hypothetical protein KSX_96840 [Ktedonospora formicarum]
MARQAKTQRIIDEAYEILSEVNPMTVRQVYYQLVSRQVVENTRSRYQAVSDALVDARLEGTIPWEWIEDRLRRPRSVAMWDDLTAFAEAARISYKRDVWASQSDYLEVWLEKDALSGIFEDALSNYGVTLNVGRGYDGWSSIRNAAQRFDTGEGVTILYFGDFDPSGEDMVRSLRDRLAELGSKPTILKVALSLDDVHRYNLPPNFTKTTDTRRKNFVEQFGDVSVELDALPADVLRARLIEEVEQRLDMKALKQIQELEEKERARLVEALRAIS